MNDILVIVLVIIVFLAGMIFIPQFMLRRAIKQVITIFRKHGATSEKSAKHIDEMGIKPQGLLSLNFGLRDYKYHAVQALIKAECVVVTDDGKVYMVEDKIMMLKI